LEASSTFFHQRLASGVEVVGQPMAGVESVALGFLIGCGARDERPEQAGISHFTEQMLFRGTERLSARDISERFDILGIDYDSSAGLEMSLLSALLLGTKLPEAIELLAEIVRTPSLLDDEIEGVRTLILQELRQREDRPAQKVMDLTRRNFFAGSPLANDHLGSEETVGSMRREDIARFWRERYGANNITVSLAGNFHWEDVISQLETITCDWPNALGRMQLPPLQGRAHVSVVEKDTAQEHIGIGLPGVSATDPGYYAMSVVAQIFGGVSNSRLRVEVREKRGLAYAAQGRFDGLEKTGLFRIYVGTSAERAHESVQVVLDQLRILEREGVSADELLLAKTRLKSQLVMRSESTAARMATNLRSWWFENRLHTLEEIRNRIDAVTRDGIQDLLNRLRMSNMVTAIGIGPRSESELFGELLEVV
jgi:predicted Zn-dependent peptidase